jgi:hypothetical protein
MRMTNWYVILGTVGCALFCVSLVNDGRPRFANADETATEPESDAPATSPESKSLRTRSGLQALYDFRSSGGSIVKDRSGVGKPVDLRITNPRAVHRTNGSLEVRGKTLIQSDKPASRITEAIRRSGEITIEAWIRPAKTNLSGPARIVTLSKNGNERSFTMGQDGDRFDVRFRTNKTSANGIPSLSSQRKSLTTRKTHVAYTRDRSGRTQIYINGKRNAERTVSGNTSKWKRSYRLGLANELSNDRPWQGTFYLVAIYNRNLTPREIQQNFKAGDGGISEPQLAKNTQAHLFETQIAPLLAKHCLDCHDSASKKGRLDLSRKELAFAGGENGKAIVPGKSAKSLLWDYVESDEMPKDQPPLSTREKTMLRKWIDAGAVWSLERIDPAIYAHAGTASEIWLQRLTLSEYIETVRSAVGVDIAKEAREILPPDLRADGFSNTAYNLNVDLKHVDAYARLAEMIVSRMDVLKFAAKFSKSRKLSTDDTMRQFVAKMGKWLLRGPLDDHEEITYSGIATTVASARGNYKEAVSYIIEAMLQSPRFIYRIENQRGDGTAWPVGEYELASRLSYILWGGPPDRELMRAADAAELSDRSRIEAQIRRMLKDPRAVEKSSRFIAEWLNLGRLDHLQPNSKRFPNWNKELAADMREETLAFFEDVVWKQKRPLSDLFNAQVTYATPRLAKHYGLETNRDVTKANDKGFSRYDLSLVPDRGGLLTQGSVLTVGGDDASMVTRGLFVFHDLLRGTVKDPPPGLDTTPVPTKPGLSQRLIAEKRISAVSCGGCHTKFEPLAFGLEKFDGVGAYHDTDEHGNSLRDDGKILFPGSGKPVSYKSSAELMTLLAESDRVRETITWKLTQFALGRPLVAEDARIVAEIHKSAQKNGGTYPALITAIIMSDLVQMTRTEQPN